MFSTMRGIFSKNTNSLSPAALSPSQAKQYKTTTLRFAKKGATMTIDSFKVVFPDSLFAAIAPIQVATHAKSRYWQIHTKKYVCHG